MDALVDDALDAGSSDNVTVVLAEVVEQVDEPATPMVVGAAAGEPRIGGSPWKLRRRDRELVMGRAVCDWLSWKR